MDKSKFKIFRSGLTEPERKALEQEAEAAKKFKEEQNLVRATARSKGFKIILDKVITSMEAIKEVRLPRCKPKELNRYQIELKVYKEFLDLFSPYVD